MPGSLMPPPVFTGLDADGNPLVGGLLSLFLAGTTTPSPGYADAALSTPLSNPVVLDSAGRAVIYLDALSYKAELRTAEGALVWTVDDMQATHAGQSGSLGDVFFFGGEANTPIEAAAFPSGTGVDTTHAGTGIFRRDAADIPAGTYVLEGMLIGLNGGTVTIGLVNLSDGAPDTALVTIASSSATGARVQSSAITFAAAGAAKDYAVKARVSGGAGAAWGLRLRRIA